MHFTFLVEVEVERTSGKFATRDEISESIIEMLDGANYGNVSSVGPDSDSEYDIIEWEITEQEQPKRGKR